MQIHETNIPSVVVVEPKILGDARGFFAETHNEGRYSTAGISTHFVQDNLSRSGKGVLRGLHLQNPRAQGKLVSVMRGRVYDVAVDVRVGSPTFGQYAGVELDDVARRQFWVPRGFAHGFVVLSDNADFFYKCDDYYSPPDEISIRWNDPSIGIAWPVDAPQLSARDAAAPLLADIMDRLPRYGEI